MSYANLLVFLRRLTPFGSYLLRAPKIVLYFCDFCGWLLPNGYINPGASPSLAATRSCYEKYGRYLGMFGGFLRKESHGCFPDM